MALWRRKAIEAFPELSRELNDGREISSMYDLWFELLPRVKIAHREGRDDFLRRAYSYADWCREESSKEIWNPVGVAFYEHLFDEPWMRPLVIQWLSTKVLQHYWSLWEARLSSEALAEVQHLPVSEEGDNIVHDRPRGTECRCPSTCPERGLRRDWRTLG